MWHLGFRGHVHLFDHCVPGGVNIRHQFGSLPSNFVLVVRPQNGCGGVVLRQALGRHEDCRADGPPAVHLQVSQGQTSKRHCSGGAAPRGHGVCDQRHPSTPRTGQVDACSLGLHHLPDQLALIFDPHSAFQLSSSPPVLLVACKPLPHLPLMCTLWSGGCHFTRQCKREQLPPKP